VGAHLRFPVNCDVVGYIAWGKVLKDHPLVRHKRLFFNLTTQDLDEEVHVRVAIAAASSQHTR